MWRPFRFNPVIRLFPTLGAAIPAMLLLIMAAPLAAAPSATAPAAAPADPEGISDTQLHDFAAAYGEVSAIRKNLLIKTHAPSNGTKTEALKKKAQKKMKAAILTHMTLGEYVRIAKAVNEDPALHARFMKIRAQTSKPPSPASS